MKNKLSKYKSTFKHASRFSKINLTIFTLIFVSIGGYFLIFSHASCIPGDVNCDGVVNSTDLSLLLSNYNTNYSAAEFDGGSIVEAHDLSILLASWGDTSGGPAPVNTVAPYFCGVNTGMPGCSQVTGDAVQGQTLTVGQGTWTNSPTSFTYQWEDCTTTGGQPPTTASCSPISGAANSSYTVQSSDSGYALVPIVTAYNGSTASVATTLSGSCDTGSTVGGTALASGTGDPDPTIAAGCSPISAVAASTQTSEKFCTNALVTCGYPDPLSGNVGVPPGTSLTTTSSVACSSGTQSDLYITGAVNITGTCTLQDSRLGPGGYIDNINDDATAVQFLNDDLAGGYSGQSNATTGTGRVTNINGACTYSYSGDSANSTDLQLFNVTGQDVTVKNSYLRCAAESLNASGASADAQNDYIISDECTGPCYSGSTTHNEAIYYNGTGMQLQNDVILNPFIQTAGLFTDCKLNNPNNTMVTGSLAATGATANGAIGVNGGGGSCSAGTNQVVTNNRYSYLYASNMCAGYISNVNTISGNIRDDTLANPGTGC